MTGIGLKGIRLTQEKEPEIFKETLSHFILTCFDYAYNNGELSSEQIVNLQEITNELDKRLGTDEYKDKDWGPYQDYLNFFKSGDLSNKDLIKENSFKFIQHKKL
jgi:hypothetical protein